MISGFVRQGLVEPLGQLLEMETVVSSNFYMCASFSIHPSIFCVLYTDVYLCMFIYINVDKMFLMFGWDESSYSTVSMALGETKEEHIHSKINA